MRPYLKGRPVSLVRAPSGIGDLFFQRHMDAAMPGARLLPESLYPGHPPCWSCRRRGRCWRQSR